MSTDSIGIDRAELASADRRIESAGTNLGRAERHLRWDPVLQLARRAPLIAHNVDAAYRLTSMGGTLVELGREVGALGEMTLAAREADATEPLPARAVGLLSDAEPRLAQVERLVAQLENERAKLGDEDLAGPLEDARARIDKELPGLRRSVATIRAWQPVLPPLLGFDGERRYLVLALNNGEILPGGGLVTAAGVMSVREGEPGDAELSDTTLWRREWVSQGGGYIEPPGPLRRYLLQDYPWNLAVSNWSPDFPTWSRQALSFYEMVHGPQEVDGIVAVDLAVLERLLALTGPVTLEVQGFGPVEFTAKNAVLELERVTREPSEEGEDRKSAVGDLTELLLERVQKLPPDKWDELLKALRELTTGSHIQVLSFAAAEQSVIEQSGLDGRLDTADGDFLMVNEASVLGTKLSMILERRATHTIALDEGGTALHTLRLNYRNALPEWRKGRDARLVEDLMGTGRYGAYVRLFVPQSALAFEVEVNGAPAAFEDEGTDQNRHWVGVFIPVTSGAEVEIALRWKVPAAAADGQYALRIQKQPGIDQFCTSYKVLRDGKPVAATLNGKPVLPEPMCSRQHATLVSD